MTKVLFVSPLLDYQTYDRWREEDFRYGPVDLSVQKQTNGKQSLELESKKSELEMKMGWGVVLSREMVPKPCMWTNHQDP